MYFIVYKFISTYVSSCLFFMSLHVYIYNLNQVARHRKSHVWLKREVLSIRSTKGMEPFGGYTFLDVYERDIKTIWEHGTKQTCEQLRSNQCVSSPVPLHSRWLLTMWGQRAILLSLCGAVWVPSWYLIFGVGFSFFLWKIFDSNGTEKTSLVSLNIDMYIQSYS